MIWHVATVRRMAGLISGASLHPRGLRLSWHQRPADGPGYIEPMRKALAGLAVGGLLALVGSSTSAGAVSALQTGGLATPHGVTPCIHHGASISISHLQSPPICVAVGTRLRIKFDKRGQGIGSPGPWAKPPASTSNSSVLGVVWTKTAGRFLYARVRAKAVGTVTLNAFFNQECSGPQTTPCTIPPEASFTVNVSVVS